MKLLIMVLGSRHHDSENLIENGIKQTWGRDASENVRVMYVYGGHERDEIVGDDVLVTANDDYVHTYEKALASFQLVYDNIDFDVVLRTSISTYVRVNYLYKKLCKCEMKDYFGSTHDHPLDKGCFWGGSALMSRDVIGKVLEHKDMKNPRRDWDDTGVEYILKYVYPNYTSIYKDHKRTDVLDGNLIRMNDPLFKIMNAESWAFRVKTPSNRNLDIEKMKLLKKIYPV